MQPTPILLIGAQKSGSSFLFRLIAQDPSIARAKLKGPKIFSKPMHDDSDFLSHFNYGRNHRYVLDGSDSYLHVAGTAERAVTQLGTDIPIIAVLRDPVERAVSGYLHEVKHGRELRAPEAVFSLSDDPDEAVVAEDVAVQAAWRSGLTQPHLAVFERYRDQLFGFRYISNSRYSHQLEPWLATFSNLRLVDFSELRVDPEGVTARVRAWLGLPAGSALEVRVPRNSTVLRSWRALRENRALEHDHTRPGLLTVWRRQRMLFSRLKKEKPAIPAGLGHALQQEFDVFKQRQVTKWL